MPLIKNFDKRAILNKVQGNDELGRCAAESWYSHVKPYIPYRTGRLCEDVTI